MQELIFPDGQIPSKDVQNKWFKIVDEFFTPVLKTESTIEQASTAIVEETKEESKVLKKVKQ